MPGIVVIHLNQPVSITVQGIQIRQSCRVTYIELLQAGTVCTRNIVAIVFIFAWFDNVTEFQLVILFGLLHELNQKPAPLNYRIRSK